MKIALNGQHILIKDPAGPERFTLNLYKQLSEIDGHKYIVLLTDKPSEAFEKWLFNKNMSYKVLPKIISWTQVSLMWELLSADYDIYFTPVHTIPVVRSFKTKFVSMIHGLEYKSNKKGAKLTVKDILQPLVIKWTTLFSDLLIVPSESTKNNILNTWWLGKANSKKLRVISEGVRDEYYSQTEDKITNTCQKYNLIPYSYLLSVSTIQPRKNIPSLVHAFSICLDQNREFKDLSLLLVGKLGWDYDESIKAPKKYNIEDNVRFLNWIPQEDLPIILAGAKGYINISLEEGFGLTILEAMASRVPILASNIPPHLELTKDTVEYVSPNNISEIADKIAGLLRDYDKQKIEKAYARSKNYTWNNTANKFVESFNSLKHH